MGIRQDFSSSILLCSEENDSVLFLEDGEEGEIGLIGEQINNFYFKFVSSFPMQSDESIKLLIERESQHLPNQRYIKRLKNGAFEASFRKDAIDWISKVDFFCPSFLILNFNLQRVECFQSSRHNISDLFCNIFLFFSEKEKNHVYHMYKSSCHLFSCIRFIHISILGHKHFI
jgi:hypothetical protein